MYSASSRADQVNGKPMIVVSSFVVQQHRSSMGRHNDHVELSILIEICIGNPAPINFLFESCASSPRTSKVVEAILSL